ncbi:MAG: hypothetical protein RJB66_74 [Pseudomonadota bacterium]|jgi:hypothetical protein
MKKSITIPWLTTLLFLFGFGSMSFLVYQEKKQAKALAINSMLYPVLYLVPLLDQKDLSTPKDIYAAAELKAKALPGCSAIYIESKPHHQFGFFNTSLPLRAGCLFTTRPNAPSLEYSEISSQEVFSLDTHIKASSWDFYWTSHLFLYRLQRLSQKKQATFLQLMRKDADGFFIKFIMTKQKE